ncbi:MAG: MFS transporter [Coriobacteriales bacterium]|nr:MFS transporter [Coriobacteriales bacterium]
MEKEKLWSKSFILITFVNFIAALNFWLLNVEMTQFCYETYSLNESIAASAITVFIVGAIFTRLLLGQKIDDWGAKFALTVSMIGFTVCTSIYILPIPFAVLLVVRFIHGIAFGLAGGSATALAILALPKSRLGEGIGYFTISMALASGIGPFVSILLSTVFDSFQMAFVCSAVSCVIGLVCMIFIKIDPARVEEAKPKEKKAYSLKLSSIIYVPVLPLATLLLATYICTSGLVSFMTMYASTLDLVIAANIFFVIYSIVMIITRPLTGKYCDTHSPNRIFIASLACVIIGMVLMFSTYLVTTNFGLIAGSITFLTAAALFGFGIGNAQSVAQGQIAKITPANELGLANSTFFLGMDVGSGLGPMLIGAVVMAIGYANAYLALAGLAVITIIFYFTICKKYYKF